MKMEITLNDDNGHEVLVIRNCHEPELVSIELINERYECRNVVVYIEDLKLALRKIGTK